MNKEEIQKELTRARAAETTIKNNIIELLEQLVEAEKPKLRHGDFGLCTRKDSKGGIVVINKRLGNPEPYFEDGLCDGCNYTKKYPDDYIIFGNIFDLLKEWSEDLEEFIYAGVDFAMRKNSLVIDINGESQTITGTDSQMEMWCKLGRLIMTLKRKLPQE